MVEIDYNSLIWGFLGLFSVIFGGIFGFKALKTWLASKADSKGYLRAKVQSQEEEILYYKKEAQKWKGRFGHTQTKPTSDANPEDPEAFIPDLIKSYKHLAPDWAKPFLNDDNMIKYLIQQAKDHPDAAKSFMDKFFKPKTDTSAPGSEDQRTAGFIQEFA